MSMITEQIKRLKELSMADMSFYKDEDYRKACKEAADTIEQLAAKVRKENGFILPENPTNGEVIKAMFPQEGDFETDFDTDWWNSPYKRGETE